MKTIKNPFLAVTMCLLVFACGSKNKVGIKICEDTAIQLKNVLAKNAPPDLKKQILSKFKQFCVKEKGWEKHKEALACYRSIKVEQDMEKCPKLPFTRWMK